MCNIGVPPAQPVVNVHSQEFAGFPPLRQKSFPSSLVSEMFSITWVFSGQQTKPLITPQSSSSLSSSMQAIKKRVIRELLEMAHFLVIAVRGVDGKKEWRQHCSLQCTSASHHRIWPCRLYSQMPVTSFHLLESRFVLHLGWFHRRECLFKLIIRADNKRCGPDLHVRCCEITFAVKCCKKKKNK